MGRWLSDSPVDWSTTVKIAFSCNLEIWPIIAFVDRAPGWRYKVLLNVLLTFYCSVERVKGCWEWECCWFSLGLLRKRWCLVLMDFVLDR